MAEPQSQNTDKRQAADSQSQSQQQPAPMAESQDQSATERQAATTEPSAQRECVSVWAIGGYLNVDVGEGKSVPVPNTFGREPTREEIYQALVAAGHYERADELADRAYGDVSGTT